MRFYGALSMQIDMIRKWRMPIPGAASMEVAGLVHNSDKRTPGPHLDESLNKAVIQIMSDVRDTLETADPYFITAEIQDIIMQSEATTPNVPLSPTWVPPHPGFLVFEKPLVYARAVLPACTCPSEQGHDAELHREDGALDIKQKTAITAIAWRPQRDTPISDPIPPGLLEPDKKGDTWTDFIFFTEGGKFNAVASWFDGMTWVVPPDKRARAIAEDPELADFINTVADDLERIRRIILALFLFMSQRLVRITKEVPNRSARRQSEKIWKESPLISVAHLRGTDYKREEQEPGEPVAWSHRWPVSAHWRSQYYPSTGEHKPLLIPTYIKGPEGLPFKAKGISLTAVDR